MTAASGCQGCGGVVVRSEEQIMLQLSEWLEWAGFEIFWNKNNEFGFGSFRVEGVREKPDLYIRRTENPRWYNTVMEVKPSYERTVRDGSKILRYLKNYASGNTKYFVQKQQVFPKYFLLATDCSIEGKLFSTESDFKPINPNGHRKIVIDYGMLPKSEYVQTFDFIRHLWVTWRDTYRRQPGTCLGILLSDKLDGGTGCPAFFYEMFNFKNSKWTQRWRNFS